MIKSGTDVWNHVIDEQKAMLILLKVSWSLHDWDVEQDVLLYLLDFIPRAHKAIYSGQDNIT